MSFVVEGFGVNTSRISQCQIVAENEVVHLSFLGSAPPFAFQMDLPPACSAARNVKQLKYKRSRL